MKKIYNICIYSQSYTRDIIIYVYIEIFLENYLPLLQSDILITKHLKKKYNN